MSPGVDRSPGRVDSNRRILSTYDARGTSSTRRDKRRDSLALSCSSMPRNPVPPRAKTIAPSLLAPGGVLFVSTPYAWGGFTAYLAKYWRFHARCITPVVFPGLDFPMVQRGRIIHDEDAGRPARELPGHPPRGTVRPRRAQARRFYGSMTASSRVRGLAARADLWCPAMYLFVDLSVRLFGAPER